MGGSCGDIIKLLSIVLYILATVNLHIAIAYMLILMEHRCNKIKLLVYA